MFAYFEIGSVKMGFSLFKSGDELYSAGLDAITRKNWREAEDKFGDAVRKGSSKSAMAELMLALLRLRRDRGNVSNYRAVAAALGKYGESSFRFGLTDVDAAALASECELSVQEIEADSIDDREYERKGQALIAAAGAFASQIGDRPMLLREMFEGESGYTGTRESNILQALAYETLGKGVVYSNPKQAAEYMQMAATFRKMLGEDGDADMRLSRQYSLSAKCWLCGRTMSGEGVHFIAVSSDITPIFKQGIDKEVVRPASPQFSSIYMCKPCFTAISNRSDEISRGYYDRTMAEMTAMEARLMAEIRSVRASIAMANR